MEKSDYVQQCSVTPTLLWDTDECTLCPRKETITFFVISPIKLSILMKFDNLFLNEFALK